MSIHPTHCQNHKKPISILVLQQSKYICQDCAIFESIYKNQQMLQTCSIQSKLNQINHKCMELFQNQKQNKIFVHDNLKQILVKIEAIHEEFINSINRQFSEVKKLVSNYYLINTQVKQQQRNLNGRQKLVQLYKQSIPQHKLKKEISFNNKLFEYKKYLNLQRKMISKISQQLLQKIDRDVLLEQNVKKAFGKIIQNQKPVKNQYNNLKSKQLKSDLNVDEDNLLDFSQFQISPTHQDRTFNSSLFQNKQQISPLSLSAKNTQQQRNQPKQQQIPTNFTKKVNKVQRMKTAECLQDSMCSLESVSKSSLNQEHHKHPNKLHNKIHQKVHTQKCLCSQSNKTIDNEAKQQFSLLSDRSFVQSQKLQTMSIAVSKQLNCSILTQQPKKSTIIQIKTRQQLFSSSKLQTISPLIKTLKLNNLSLSTQEFTSILKQKISQSFISSLQINSNNKLQDKILLEIKQYKPKTLKKVQIKNCKQINWNDRRVKEMVKKLEGEGLKIVY